MAERKLNIPKNFIDKYGTNFPIWSYSKCSSIDNCIYEYFLSKILKYPSEQNIYSEVGGLVHNILEDFYNKKIPYGNMKNKFIEDFENTLFLGYKFYKDKKKNDITVKSYQKSIEHFFDTHNIIPYKIYTEKEVWIEIDNHVFVGYIDVMYQDEDKNIYILDYKTSSISGYTGKKKEEKAMQLLLYALALNQLGFPLERIKCCWNFLKYVDVEIETVNSKGKITYKKYRKERNKWIEGIKEFLFKELIMEFPDLLEWEIDIKIEECIRMNSIDTLPDSIKNKIQLYDAIEYIDVNEDNIEKVKRYLVKNIQEINSRTKNENWNREYPIDKGSSFYCSNLCGLKKYCKYYQDYIEKWGE